MGIIINKDKSFTFNGTNSASFGLIVSGGGTYGAPKRSYEKVSIPGRNGSLLIDNGYYEDVEIEYKSVGFVEDVFYPERLNLEKRVASIRDWLLSPLGYQRLEDSWHPDEYRLAYLSDSFSPEMCDSLEGGMVDLKFTAKPQRFLKSGEKKIALEQGVAIFNPSKMEAIPEIRLQGNGTIYINSDDNKYTINVNDSVVLQKDGPTIIDTLLNASKNGVSANSYTTINLNGKDKLILGKKTICTWNGFSNVILIPNWWRL